METLKTQQPITKEMLVPGLIFRIAGIDSKTVYYLDGAADDMYIIMGHRFDDGRLMRGAHHANIKSLGKTSMAVYTTLFHHIFRRTLKYKDIIIIEKKDKITYI